MAWAKARAVAAIEIEQQPLQIAGDLDIHARAQRGLHGFDLHAAGAEEAGEDIVAVGADDQPLHRQAHLPRAIGGIDVAEIPGRHGERDGTVGRAQRHRGPDVVDDLRHHPRPVDGVHRRELQLVAEGEIVEHRLHQVLAIVEGAFDGDVEDVGGVNRGHLPPLHLGDAAIGMEDEDFRRRPAAEGLDRRRAGIARGRADDGDMLAALSQHMVVEPAEQLQRHILEGQGRPVEQLHQPGLAVELAQRRHGAMAEGGVAVSDDPREGIGLHPAGDEGRHDAHGQLGILQAAEGFQVGRRQARPGFRHIKPAVASQAREQDIIEGERRGGAPGADIAQGGLLGGLGCVARGHPTGAVAAVQGPGAAVKLLNMLGFCSEAGDQPKAVAIVPPAARRRHCTARAGAVSGVFSRIFRRSFFRWIRRLGHVSQVFRGTLISGNDAIQGNSPGGAADGRARTHEGLPRSWSAAFRYTMSNIEAILPEPDRGRNNSIVVRNLQAIEEYFPTHAAFAKSAAPVR